jgi:hypothetical protein
MLHLLEILLTLTHLLIIGFNLFGWIWPSLRRAHLICVILTAGSWFVIGAWYGIGYCPVTDWEWQIKERLGERNLPNSFIKYYADKLTGSNFSSNFIDTVTVVCFAVAALLSIYFNFFYKKAKPSNEA